MKMGQRKHPLGATVICSIALLLLLFGTAADIIGYWQFTDTVTAQYLQTAQAIAEEAASFVSAEDADTFLQTNGEAETFVAAQTALQRLCNHMDASFIFVVAFENDTCDVAVCAIEAVHDDSAFPAWEVGHRQNLAQGEYVPYQKAFQTALRDNLDATSVTQNRGKIETSHHVAAIRALRDENGTIRAFLCVQKQMDGLSATRLRYIRAIVLTSLLLMLLAGASTFFFVRHRILHPLANISREAERFSSELVLPAAPLANDIRWQDELGLLAAVIDKMEIKTLESAETLARITAEKERVDSELNLAREIQTHVLPSIFPPFPDHPEFDIFATMEPAKEVGGDFYDFFLTDDTHIAVVIADVSGKGIPAALFMMIAKTLIKNHMQMGLSPAAVFEKVNAILCENNEVGCFVTAWMGVLNLEDGTLTYVNAGHNPPLLKSGNEFRFLKSAPGFVLAGLDGIRYRQQTVLMKPGDRLFLYTDGVTEATDSQKRLYGNDRLNAYLNKNTDDFATDVLHGLRRDIDAFVGAEEQFDDITMLMLDYRHKPNGGAEKTLPAQVSCLQEALDFVESAAQAAGCSPKDRMAFALCAEEMFVNVAHYAYPEAPGTVTLTVQNENECLSLTLTDEGVPFNPLEKQDPDVTLAAEDREIGGLGIYLVKKNMDEVTYERTDGKNRFTMRKDIKHGN